MSIAAPESIISLCHHPSFDLCHFTLFGPRSGSWYLSWRVPAMVAVDQIAYKDQQLAPMGAILIALLNISSITIYL
jgi:hypothetical protein